MLPVQQHVVKQHCVILGTLLCEVPSASIDESLQRSLIRKSIDEDYLFRVVGWKQEYRYRSIEEHG